jgi:hypothetical protein
MNTKTSNLYSVMKKHTNLEKIWIPPGEGIKLFETIDNPKFCSADQAAHMREDDHVVGVVYEGEIKAYPLWIADYYHSVNDMYGKNPVTFST